jgi:predicted extracellular nuclease
MKKNLPLFAFMVLSSLMAQSQCTDLFISEYVEGSNNNKALELYNPTNATIDLSAYQLKRYSNGSTTATSAYTVDLSGSIAAYDVVVLVIDLQDTTLTGQDTAAFEELREKADYFLCPDYDVSSAIYFNGDDAVTIEKNSAIIDLFGKVGEDPGSSWTDVYPYVESAGGAYWTKDQTLIRKASVKAGVTSNPSYFNATTEWDSLPENTFDSLGTHVCDCKSGSSSLASSAKLYNDRVYLFPNPAIHGKHLNVKGTSIITNVEIYNLRGEVMLSTNNENKTGEMPVSLESIASGMYYIRVIFNNSNSVLKEFSIR